MAASRIAGTLTALGKVALCALTGHAAVVMFPAIATAMQWAANAVGQDSESTGKAATEVLASIFGNLSASGAQEVISTIRESANYDVEKATAVGVRVALEYAEKEMRPAGKVYIEDFGRWFDLWFRRIDRGLASEAELGVLFHSEELVNPVEMATIGEDAQWISLRTTLLRWAAEQEQHDKRQITILAPDSITNFPATLEEYFSTNLPKLSRRAVEAVLRRPAHQRAWVAWQQRCLKAIAEQTRVPNAALAREIQNAAVRLHDRLGVLESQNAETHEMLKKVLTSVEPLTTQVVRPVGGGPARARSGMDKAGFEFMRRVDELIVGREPYFGQLDEAWDDPGVGLVCIVAFGGVGKTSLAVNWWRKRPPSDTRFFCYSFYNQGTAEGNQIASEPFVDYALREWFGASEPQLDVWRRGVVLADLVRSKPTFVLLDGLEPLQKGTPPNVMLEDNGVSGFLSELASTNPGLCVCTSRLPLNDLERTSRGIASIDLENLSPEAGAAYLEMLGANGLEEERRRASVEFGNHALALTLLGRYIGTAKGGDIRQRDTIPDLTAERKQGRHARRVLRGYKSLLNGKPELSLMRMLGLFDRPAEAEALRALREASIPGLSGKIDLCSGNEWEWCLDRLRALRLVQCSDFHGVIDCHPLVRSYFAELLRKQNHGETWKDAHRRLYTYFESCAPDRPETAQEMEPLYSAVVHAGRAGDYQHAWETYWQRIQRGHPTYYNTNALGGFQSGLAMLATFYRHPWSTIASQVKESLDETSYCKLQEEVGFHLKGVGRFDEATTVMKRALLEYATAGDFAHAAVNAENIGESLGLEGHLSKALAYLDPASYADKCDDAFRRMSTLSARGEIFHQMGRYGKAEEAFAEAEDIRQERFWDRKPVRGLYYLDLLVDLHRYDEFGNLAARFRPLLDEDKAKLFTGVYELFVGRAESVQVMEGAKKDSREALERLARAVRLIDESKAQHFQPRAPCERARLLIYVGRLNEAKADLDKALLIARRGRLVLYEADSRLGLCEWCLQGGMYSEGRSECEAASSIITRTQYLRQEAWCAQLRAKLEMGA